MYYIYQEKNSSIKHKKISYESLREKEPNRKNLELNNSADATMNALETADHVEERIRKLEDRNLGMVQAAEER